MDNNKYVKIDTIDVNDLVTIQSYLTSYKNIVKKTAPSCDIEEAMQEDVLKTIQLLEYKLEYFIQDLASKNETRLV